MMRLIVKCKHVWQAALQTCRQQPIGMFIQDGACNEACLVQAALCGGQREICVELLKLDDLFDMQGQYGYLLA